MSAFKISASKKAVSSMVQIIDTELANQPIEDKEENKALVEINSILQQLKDQLGIKDEQD